MFLHVIVGVLVGFNQYKVIIVKGHCCSNVEVSVCVEVLTSRCAGGFLHTATLQKLPTGNSYVKPPISINESIDESINELINESMNQ